MCVVLLDYLFQPYVVCAGTMVSLSTSMYVTRPRRAGRYAYGLRPAEREVAPMVTARHAPCVAVL